MSEAKEKSKRNEKRIKWNETDEKRNNTNIEKRMNAAKLGVERSKANKILSERTNEWTYERKQQQSKAEEKKNIAQQSTVRREYPTTTEHSQNIHRAWVATAMAIHWECVYDPIWEGNGALKHKIHTKSCVHSVRIYSDLVALGLWMYRQPIFFSVRLILYERCSVLGYQTLAMPKSTSYTLSTLYKWWCFSALEHTHIFCSNINFVVLSFAVRLWQEGETKSGHTNRRGRERGRSRECEWARMSSVAVVSNLFWSPCTAERSKI